jgi:hypothetical protein
MKTISNILTTIAAVIIGLLLATVFVMIGLMIYTSIRGIEGIAIALLISLVGIFLGFVVYSTAKRRGILEFLTTVRASPELDNLEPTENSDFRKLTIAEYLDKFKNGDRLFNGGLIRIWGDFKSRKLDKFNEIQTVKKIDLEKFQINFVGGNQLTIWNPEIILESLSYLKILKAERIRWEWHDQNGTENYYDYSIIDNKIKTVTNTDWISYKIDTLLGVPAIEMIN